MAAKEKQKLECLLLAPHDAEYHPVQKALQQGARQAGILLKRPEDTGPLAPPGSGLIQSQISRADLIAADVSRDNQNALFELGLAQAIGKPLLLLTRAHEPAPLFATPSVGMLAYETTRQGLSRLETQFRRILEEFRSSPKSFAPLSVARPAPVPFVDLEKLEPREFENLCFELLTQIGFRRVEWGKEIREVDVVATLRKKDPDGFEYQELWLISMGIHAPFEVLLDMASHPEFLYHMMVRRRESGSANFDANVPLTFLFIPFRRDPDAAAIEREAQRLEMRTRERPSSPRYRIRIWNTEHLVSLIQQYPQLAHKYFSEEGRAQSKYRKTPEELYRENVKLTERVQATLAQLRVETDKRTRAERDAVWKELSFTAAHKLGNPVFALETDLQALKKRIKPTGSAAAAEVAEEMGSSLEKAKAIIEQFKSLTKAQEISPQPVDLVPLIRRACRVAGQNDVRVQVQHSEQLPQVLVDPGRTTECFDELTSNALHWFDKPEKKISVSLDQPKEKELPEPLDRSRSYVRVRFEDNGCGVPIEQKEKIFDPFFTTHPHGTGLGLALVERIMEGQSGLIREIGKPGDGAVFEIFLPTAPKGKR